VVKKVLFRYGVDVLLFGTGGGLLVTGLILAIILPPGSKDKLFLGLRRHGWGDLHFWLSMAFSFLTGVHVWLAWDWIVGTSRSLFGVRWKRALFGICITPFLVVILGWMLSKSPRPREAGGPWRSAGPGGGVDQSVESYQSGSDRDGGRRTSLRQSAP